MNKILRTSVIALAGACFFTLTTPLVAGAQSVKNQTSLYNCSTPTARPSNIVITCADAGRYVAHITWSSWSGKSAHAKGTLHWNTCTPTCASGKEKSQVINFIATDRRKVHGTWLYTELKGPKNAWGTGSAIWSLPTAAL
jgi:hypothetical protein